jgi:uroporphyrinogen III methyltransferase/synthase
MSAPKRAAKTKAPLRGICHLAGAGPGDLGLVTLRVRELLEISDVVVFDYLCNPEMLKWTRSGVDIIYAGKKAGQHTLRQEEINALLVEKTKAGHRVLRLKGGDPFLFGRGGEEAEALAEAGLEFEIVPGVTSAIAAPAYAGIPVTHRDFTSSLTIFTGHEDPTKPETALDYARLAALPGTKVMLMGVERMGPITAELQKYGLPSETPIALVRWGTTGRQETLSGTVGNIAQKILETGFEAPAVAVMGEVATLRNKLGWFEKRPLRGKRIVVTRTRQQAGVLSAELRALGADVYELPTIRIEPPEDLRAFAELVQDVHAYDWLVFTSPNGVSAFFEMFFKLYSDAREIGGVRIAAIGPATAKAVRAFHLAVELVKLGAIVDEAVAYRTVAETEDVSGGIARFRKEGADLITFTSSSTAENFLALKLPLPNGLKTASIGPITSQTMRDLGLSVDMEAEQYDIPGLIAAIRAYYGA